jgi:hypothetical protein
MYRPKDCGQGRPQFALSLIPNVSGVLVGTDIRITSSLVVIDVIAGQNQRRPCGHRLSDPPLGADVDGNETFSAVGVRPRWRTDQDPIRCPRD